jgi:D-glycero-alpha-D-manno-heptose-7-phosphate kinase
VIVRAKAPLRISFFGGGTDIPPYPERHGGMVLSATIDKYAYCSLSPLPDRELLIESLDYDVMAKFDRGSRLVYDGSLDLAKACVNLIPGIPDAGFRLLLHSDAPPGTGLGSSSSLVVAIVGAIKEWARLSMTDYEVAGLAHRIERTELGIAGGLQDQYASAFGGFNSILFGKDAVTVDPIELDSATLNELQYRLLLCYVGTASMRDGIIDDQVRRYSAEEPAVMLALARMKDVTGAGTSALLAGKLDAFGALLHEDWEATKQLQARISNPRIDAIYVEARRAGAVGGKLLGAGGGGYLLAYCASERKRDVAQALERSGGQLVEFAFESRGLQTWRFSA